MKIVCHKQGQEPYNMYNHGDPWTLGPLLHLVCRKVVYICRKS